MQNLLFIGLGRIGLPQSLAFAKKGLTVFAYDHDRSVYDQLMTKGPSFYEPGLVEYLNATLGQTFMPLSNWDEVVRNLPKIDAIFFTLGTAAPDSQMCLDEEELNLDTIQITLDKIFSHKAQLAPNIKLIFRTTLPLGSVDRLRHYIESNYQVTEGDDFHLAFVPERLIEGQAIQEEETLPKIIGTYNETAFSQIKDIFSKLGGKIIRVADPKTAEFCKLTDNSFRNTLFAFANEIAMCAAENQVDVMEVIEAVNTDYARNAIQKPGFVSGYCLGKDPYIFEYGFNRHLPARGELCSLWYYGRRTNDYLIDYVVQKIKNNLKNIDNPVVVLMGLSFKEDVDDFRMSHSIQIIQKLMACGITQFRVFDPNLGKNKYTILPDDIESVVSYKTCYLDDALFDNAHAVLVAHRHAEIVMSNKRKGLAKLLSNLAAPAYVFDAWNVWGDACMVPTVKYDALGRGGE